MASRTVRARTAAALVVLASLACTGVAFAEPSLSDRETARAAMDEGDAKRDKGDLKGALKSYQAADAIMGVPTTGIEVARTQAALGLLLEARETLAKVLRTPPKPGEPPAFTNARKAAETLNGELATRIPSVTIAVQPPEPNAPVQITFDGENVPPAATQAPRKVNPGKHVIVARSGAAERTEEISVAERESKTVNIDLAKKAAIGPGPSSVDDGSSPESTGSGSGWKVVMWSGFAVGAIGVGIGSVTGIMAFSKTSDVESQCTGTSCPPRVASDLDSSLSTGTISTVAFVIGGVGLATGVLGLVMSKSASTPEGTPVARVRVKPEVGPTWAGLSGVF
ncbi:MAG: hypothetical protein JST00_39370 [Deltaproteobacteria bacterium]|nr:hypothetical protein [Deltaproteobacteria bacterium]